MSTSSAPLTEADRRALREVFAGHPEVQAAYLFGSHAEGQARGDSDVDVGIVVRDEETFSGEDRLDLIGKCMDAVKRDWIDLPVLNDAPLVLQFEAVRHHDCLYSAGDFSHPQFTSKVARMYWDFQPYLRRQREAMKRRLLEEDEGDDDDG
jgi:predicted nucleotidyltransferase